MKNQVLERIWIQFTVFSLGIAVLVAIFQFHPFRTGGAPDAPGRKSGNANVRVTDVSSREATLYWQTESPTAYTVLMGMNEGQLTEAYRDDAKFTNAHMVRLTDLVSKRTYYIQLVYKKQDGSEEMSEVFSFRTKQW